MFCFLFERGNSKFKVGYWLPAHTRKHTENGYWLLCFIFFHYYYGNSSMPCSSYSVSCNCKPIQINFYSDKSSVQVNSCHSCCSAAHETIKDIIFDLVTLTTTTTKVV